MREYERARGYVFVCACIFQCVHMRIGVRVCACLSVYAGALVNVCICVYVCACIRAYGRACVCA